MNKGEIAVLILLFVAGELFFTDLGTSYPTVLAGLLLGVALVLLLLASWFVFRTFLRARTPALSLLFWSAGLLSWGLFLLHRLPAHLQLNLPLAPTVERLLLPAGAGLWVLGLLAYPLTLRWRLFWPYLLGIAALGLALMLLPMDQLTTLEAVAFGGLLFGLLWMFGMLPFHSGSRWGGIWAMFALGLTLWLGFVLQETSTSQPGLYLTLAAGAALALEYGARKIHAH